MYLMRYQIRKFDFNGDETYEFELLNDGKFFIEGHRLVSFQEDEESVILMFEEVQTS